MKTALLALFLSTTIFAQEESNNSLDKKHEIKVDAIELIVVANIEITYEYLISKYSGAGISITFDGGNSSDDFLNWAITPFYRQYFFNRQEKRAQGLFAEGHLNLGSFENDYYQYTYDTDTGFIVDERFVEHDKTAFGAGFALGYKWASNNGFVIEPSVGVGRNIIGNTQDDGAYYDSIDFYFRGGIQVGYRF
ncbi:MULTISPECIES: DUF3575 domain-containing protein [unclassified Leeuwenhoekiella]|uniref:DUF3575 domain-containing protein n=1 Tax=unclassified Leeuwenhoekiella TaxID=2615029 RepID=UPI0025BD5A9A|nr:MULTISPECIES: DUF3575 domain-containing protein [unclassified Leeuwenhoekiella]